MPNLEDRIEGALARRRLPKAEVAGVVAILSEARDVAPLVSRIFGRELPVLAITPGEAEFCTDTYLAIASFVVEVGASTERVILIEEKESPAARDVLERRSARFTEILAPSPEGLTDLCSAFAEHLLEMGETLHALKFFLLADSPARSMRMQIAECWAALDRPERAQESVDWQSLEQPERRRLERDLFSLRAEIGAIEESTRRENLKALGRFDPTLAAKLDADAGELVVVRARSNGVEVPLVIETIGRRVIEHNPPGDTTAVLDAIAKVHSPEQAHALVGTINDLSLLRAVVESPVVDVVPNWKQAVYAVETNTRVLAALLRGADLGFLADERIRLFAGDDAEANAVEFFRTNENRPLPGLRFSLRRGLHDALNEVIRERKAMLEQSFARIHALDRPERLEGVLQALDGRRPLRVLSMSSLHTTVLQYQTRNLLQGFEKLGHETRLFIQSDVLDTLEQHAAARMVAEFDPDVVLMIDHLRSEYPVDPARGQPLFPRNVPFVCWVQDELPRLKEPARIRALGPLDFTFGFNTSVRDHFVDLGYSQMGHLPFAVDADAFAFEPNANAESSVAYVTHLVEPQAAAHVPWLKPWLCERLATFAEVPVEMPLLDPLLDEAYAEFGQRLRDEDRRSCLYWALSVARFVDRLRVAEGMRRRDIPLALYGRGWDEIPSFAPFARGTVSGDALARVYRDHKVVLHVNRGCNFHMRVLEASAAGGFVLARAEHNDDKPGEIGDSFAIGTDLHFFRDDDELASLARRAFGDEAWRGTAIANANARVRGTHTYENRAAAILGELRQKLPSALRRAA
jgi:hypothetical protein